VLLLIAAIFNRVHGEGTNTKGDRVISGLLALPLITLWVKLVFPNAITLWALVAPLPLAIYVVLLSCTTVPPAPCESCKSDGADEEGDSDEQPFSLKNLTEDRFTLALLVICGSFYIVLAAFALKGFG
jgi:hypothetical protein